MRRFKVVHLITRLELGGAQQNTLYCAAHHDRSRFDVGVWAGVGGRLDPAARAIPDADVRLVPWLVHSIRPHIDAVAGPHTMLVVTGGWARDEAVLEAKRNLGGTIEHPPVQEAGCRGAAGGTGQP